jgi:hypothetical protein
MLAIALGTEGIRFDRLDLLANARDAAGFFQREVDESRSGRERAACALSNRR